MFNKQAQQIPLDQKDPKRTIAIVAAICVA